MRSDLMRTEPENSSDQLNAFLHRIDVLLDSRREKGADMPVVAAIDGMCGSGKTTCAEWLARKYGCSVIHMDDFYLPVPLRTPQRYAEPGGNVHYERFLDEIVKPLAALRKKVQNARQPFGMMDGEMLVYRKFDCMHMDYADEPVRIPVTPLLVIEGTYSLRREFLPLYDITAFMTCSKETQKARLLKRNGRERWEMFRTKWIPLECAYFDSMHPADAAMYRICMDSAVTVTHDGYCSGVATYCPS